MSSFDIRIRLYSSDMVRGKVLPAQELTLTAGLGGMPVVSAKVSEKVFGTVPAGQLFAIEYSDGDTWTEPDDGRFIFPKGGRDSTDPAEIHTLTGVGFLPWLLQRNRLQVSAGKAERVWNGSPGNIGSTAIIEAQSRGWGPHLTYDYTASEDSAEEEWDTTIKQSFNIGTTAWDMIQWLVTAGQADFTTTGNVAHLWKPGYGVDRASGSSPVRITEAATSAPISWSIEDVFTKVTAQGDGIVTASASVESSLGLGTLEGWVQAGGSKTKASALAAAKKALAAAASERREHSVTFQATAGGPRPWIDFDKGDLVQARYEGSWVTLRVVEWVMRRNTEGAVEVTVVLGDKIKSVSARLAERPFPGASGAVTPGEVPSPVDQREPKAPTGVEVTATAGWSDSGLPIVEAEASWTAVTDATTDEPITVVEYEVQLRLSTESAPHRVTSTAETSVPLHNQPAGKTILVSVRARSAAGVWSEFSDETTKELPNPTTVLDAPTDPTLSSKLGVVSVGWDGDLSTGAPDPQFRYVYPVMSSTEAGTYLPVGTPMGNAGSTQVSDLTMGGTYWFKLIAVDSRGVASSPSAAKSVVVVGVTGPDIEANSVTANEIAAGAIEAQHLSLGAAMPYGNPVDRVPAPLTDTNYWGLVSDGTIDLLTPPSGVPQRRWASGSTGITLTPTSTEDARLFLTARLPVPASRAIRCDVVPDETTVVTNYYPNPVAEGPSLPNETTSGVTSVEISDYTTTGWDGPSSFKIVCASTSSASAALPLAESIPAAEGEEWTGSVEMFNGASGTRDLRLFMRFRDESGNVLQDSSTGAISTGAATSTGQVYVTATAPEDTASVTLLLQRRSGTGATAGDVFYARQLMLTVGDTEYEPFDGSLPTEDGVVYAWQGTPNDSPSTMTSASGVKVVWWDDEGTATVASIPSRQSYQLPDDAVTYAAFIDQDAGLSARLVQAAHVFEAIGNAVDEGQFTRLTPQGIEVADLLGNTGVRIGTWDDNLFTTFTLNEFGQLVTQASIDNAGVGTFNDLNTNDDISASGIPVVGDAGQFRVNGVPLSVPILERMPLGQVFSTGLGTDGTAWGEQYMQITGTTAYQAVGAAKLQLNDGRRYRVSLDAPIRCRWQASPTSTSQLWLEVWVGDTQQVLTDPNGVMRRWRLLDGTHGGGAGTPLYVFPISPSKPFEAASDSDGYSYMLARIVRVSSTTSYLIETVGGGDENTEPTLTIEDVGSADVDPYVATTKVRTTSGTPSTPGSTTTKQFACTWSQSWGSSGAYTSPSGDTFIDSRLLHQGQSGFSKMGLAGWPALSLSGHSIKKMRIRLRNRFTGYGTGATLQVGFNSAAAPPGGSKPTPSYRFDVHVNKGQTIWVTVPTSILESGLASAIALGTIRSMTIGTPSGGSTQTNAIFDGQPASNAYGSSLPPLFEFTYE